MSFSPSGTVVFVDDDAVIRDATMQSMELAGLDARAFPDAAAALAIVDAGFNGVIVSDIRMPGMDGLQFFQRVHAVDPSIPFILITGHGDIPTAVAALRDGVDDFIPKPFASAHLIASVQRGLARRRLELDNRILWSMVQGAGLARSPLVGEAPAMVRLRKAIDHVAAGDLDVFVEGEAGVGKSLVALMVHRASPRRAQPFVSVRTGGLPPEIAQRQLFGDAGYSRGATPSAGQVAQAHRGTLFVEDLRHLDDVAQQRLLAVIEDREMTPEGAERPVHVDVRVIAGSRSSLDAKAGREGIRDDLFHALNVVRLHVPPLRERREDIPLLFAHFVDEASTQLRRPPARLSAAVRRHLVNHDWPGNVRELKSFAFQATLGLDFGGKDGEAETASLPARVDRFEAAAIRAVLAEAKGSAVEAIRLLGIPRKTFYDKLHRHGITIAEFRR